MATRIPHSLSPYVDDVAFVVGEKPASTLDEFIDQLNQAALTLSLAGVNGAEDLEIVAVHLYEYGLPVDGGGGLAALPEMIDEFRQVVAQNVVDRYICASMEGNGTITTSVIEACMEWDRAHPERGGAAMAQIRSAYGGDLPDTFR